VAQKLLGDALPEHTWTKHFLKLPTLTAISVQIDLDEPAWPVDRVIFAPGTVLSSFSEQSRTTFKRQGGRLSIDLTSTEKINSQTDEQLYELVIEEGKRIGLDIKSHTQQYRVIRHTDEFYRPEPGANQYRPTQETPIPGLVLAGDYTEQPNPSVMEGAVISGQRAAEVILKKD
jgi:15-cis-phytoene desaturase